MDVHVIRGKCDRFVHAFSGINVVPTYLAGKRDHLSTHLAGLMDGGLVGWVLERIILSLSGRPSLLQPRQEWLKKGALRLACLGPRIHYKWSLSSGILIGGRYRSRGHLSTHLAG